VTFTVNPNGSVSNVNAGGDPKGYPGLSRCIRSKVSTWRFPPSGGSTPVSVPFVFARQ
jgi:TonB family protein